jgi:hypothetical protein
MDRNYIDIKFCSEIAPNLPIERINEIIGQSKALTADEIIFSLLTENENYEKPLVSMSAQSLLSGDQVYTMKCQDVPCTKQNCNYFHNPSEYRRPQAQFSYLKKPCKYVFIQGKWNKPSKCLRKNKCKHCHTENEIKYYKINENSKAKTSQPVEFIKFEEPPSNSLKFVIDSIATLKSEIKHKQSQLRIKQKQLHELNQKISQFLIDSKCVVCKLNEHEFVAVPCGHLMCSKCKPVENCTYCNMPGWLYNYI